MKQVKFNYYNNGQITIKIYPEQEIPEGFVKGRLNQKESWNKGLTAETDERVKQNIDKTHQTRRSKNNYKAWNKNLKAETDERVKLNVENTQTTLKLKYNVDNPSQVNHVSWNLDLTKETDERVKKISESKKGKPSKNKGKHIKSGWTNNSAKKRHDTQLKNGTLGKNKDTKVEKSFYTFLLTMYPLDDIQKQYFDNRYPYKCDFYIKSEDLFIEINGTWTHSEKPYNPDDEWCQKELKKLEKKIQETNSNYYKNKLYTWTDLDVRKLNILKQNNLNYKIIYTPNINYEEEKNLVNFWKLLYENCEYTGQSEAKPINK